MQVDVIIPVFNGSARVPRAVRSVLDQSGTHGVTIWCIDDASTDVSATVLVGLARGDERVQVIRNESNVGVSTSRNTAIRAGAAELIAFLDQDDSWVSDKLERQLAVLEARPELGYVVGLQHMTLDDGATAPAWSRPEWLEGPQAGYLPGTLVVWRSVFDAVGPFDESMRAGGDDTDWFARARRLGVPHVMVENVVLTRYLHDSNLSSDTRSNDELLALVRRHVASTRGSE